MISNRRGVSYAISAVIMTAAIVVLVFVTSIYTYQILEQQRGAAEFQVVEKSILAFDDALENIAWKPHGTRSTRFTVEYGQLELLQSIPLLVQVSGYEDANRSISTGMVRYRTETRYMNFGENYSAYILGHNQIVSNGTGGYGRAFIEQKSGWVTLTLFYGVRAMETSTVNITEDGLPLIVSYVDIWIIQIDVVEKSTYIGNFDLKASCLDVITLPTDPYTVNEDNRRFNISVRLGDNDPSQTLIQLDDSADQVVFNFVVATVRLTV